MGRVAAKFVPRHLTGEQWERRLQACFELQNQLKEDPDFISKVITGDECKTLRFASVEEVKQKLLEGLKNIPISEFKKCFEQWKDRLQKCVVVKEEYFEGDKNLV